MWVIILVMIQRGRGRTSSAGIGGQPILTTEDPETVVGDKLFSMGRTYSISTLITLLSLQGEKRGRPMARSG